MGLAFHCPSNGLAWGQRVGVRWSLEANLKEWGDYEVGNLREEAVDGLNASHCPNSCSSSKTLCHILKFPGGSGYWPDLHNLRTYGLPHKSTLRPGLPDGQTDEAVLGCGQRISSSSSSSSVDRRLGPCKMSASSSSSPGLSTSSSSSSSPSALSGVRESGGSGEGGSSGVSGEVGTTSFGSDAPATSSGRFQASKGGSGPPGVIRLEVVLRKLARGGRRCTPDLVCPSMAFCSWEAEGKGKKVQNWEEKEDGAV